MHGWTKIHGKKMALKRPGRTRRKRVKMKKCGEIYRNLSHESVYVNLLRWLTSNGFEKTKLKPAICNGTGRGLINIKRIDAGEILMSVPKELIITTKVVLLSFVAPYIKQSQFKMSPRQCIALFLICERAMGEKSFWFPYINSLPKTFLMISGTNDTDSLAGFPRSLECRAIAMRNQMESQLTQIQELATKILRDFPVFNNSEDYFSYENFCWAWNCINTRCVYMPQPFCEYLNGEKDHFALVPFFDLFNHSPDAKVKTAYDTSGCYKVFASTPLKSYGEVLVNYGSHDNENLLLHYGFTVPDNPNTTLYVSVDGLVDFIRKLNGSENSGSWSGKVDAVQKFGLLKGLSFGRNGPSWSLRTVVEFLLQHDDGSVCIEAKLRQFLDCHDAILSREAVAVLSSVLTDHSELIQMKINSLSVRNWVDSAAMAIWQDYGGLVRAAMQQIHNCSTVSRPAMAVKTTSTSNEKVVKLLSGVW